MDNMLKCAPPLKMILGLMKRVRLAVPMMTRIWRKSEMARAGGHERIKQVYARENDYLKKVEKGEWSLDSRILDGEAI